MRDPLSDSALDVIFRKARSYNGFLDEPVSEDQIRALWDMIKWGPTSANQLPGRFVWCMSPESKAKLARCCSGNNEKKVLQAPVTVIIGMDENFHVHLPTLFPHVNAKVWFDGNRELRKSSAFRNSSLQGAYLIIAARALGLDVGPMSGFNEDAVNNAFFSDNDAVSVNFIATIGYGDPKSIFSRLPRPDFSQFNSLA
jgi:3-hydroxypropanoate dehydrogenase